MLTLFISSICFALYKRYFTFEDEHSKQRAKEIHKILRERKYINEIRWMCISRPQYKYSCGVASLTAVWNYLYTTLGHGSLPPQTHEDILRILGFREPYADIRFGPFTGNEQIMNWFRVLCSHFKVKGKTRYFWKGLSSDMNEKKASQIMKKELKEKHVAYIYHCYNHYMVPIGYEETFDNAIYAYEDAPENAEKRVWLICGDSSKTNRNLQCVKFSDIEKDLSIPLPKYFNARHPEKGIMVKEKQKKSGGNIHCILEFRSDLEEDISPELILKERKKNAVRSLTRRRDEIFVSGHGKKENLIIESKSENDTQTKMNEEKDNTS